MIFVSALIVCGFLSCIFANDSCFNRTEYDYDFYIVEKLVEDVNKRIKYLKGNFKAAVSAHCPSTTCQNKTCPDGWVSYKTVCLLFANDQSRTFQEARDFCTQRGSDLMYVSDKAENNFIVGMLGGFRQDNWYIGLTDQNTEGIWRWLYTNSTAEYTDWSVGHSQPTGGTSENCVIYHSGDSFHWHDVSCTAAKYPTICKKGVL